MSKERADKMKRICRNPDMISGIHNYCDRWCERCSFTSRCAVSAMEPEGGRDPESLDMENEAFWNELSDNLLTSFELLKEMLIEHGIDPDDPPSEEYTAKYNKIKEAAENHPLVKDAEDYMKAVMEWFEESNDMFEDKAGELASKIRLELPDSDPEEEVIELNDIVDVIQWYCTMIPAKIGRAVHGKIEGVPDIIKDMPRDCDGSAKIALISLDRSLAAWIKMREHFPQYNDDILDFLVSIEKIRKTTEYEFPQARSFIRPGFDEN